MSHLLKEELPKSFWEMKLNCLLATAAVAQFDYNPNAEYDNDYNPDNTILSDENTTIFLCIDRTLVNIENDW